VLFGGIATLVFGVATGAMFVVFWGVLPLLRRISLAAGEEGDSPEADDSAE